MAWKFLNGVLDALYREIQIVKAFDAVGVALKMLV